MAETRPGVMLYFETLQAIEELDAEEAKQIMSAILHYCRDGEEPAFSGMPAALWHLIRNGLDRDGERYNEKQLRGYWLTYCRKCKEAGLTPLGFDEWAAERAVNDTLPFVERTVYNAVNVGQPSTSPTTSTTPASSPSSYAVGYVVGAAQVFFTETVPAAVGGMLQTVGTFFTETIPTWAEGVALRATTFFTETVPAAVGSLLQNVGNFFTETLPAWAEGVGQRAAVFFGETLPTFVGNLLTNVGTFFTETIPEWAAGAFEAATTFFTQDIPKFIGNLWDNVTGFVTETIPQWGQSIANKVSGWFSSVSDWFSGIWDTVSGAFTSGYEEATGGSGTGAHAEGGIMNAPHLAQVAEDGPEAIIPLGASSRSRGMAVWEEAGDILGVNSRPRVGSNDDGLDDIILAGNGGGYAGPQGGGNGDDVPVYTSETPGRTGPAEVAQSAPVSAPVSIVLNQENNIQATDRMSAEEVAQILNDRIRGMVDDIGDEMAEKLARIFANMPVRGGA